MHKYTNIIISREFSATFKISQNSTFDNIACLARALLPSPSYGPENCYPGYVYKL